MSQTTTPALEQAIAILTSASSLANALGVSVQAVGQWKAGERPISPERCAEIERLTKGAVVVEDLAPNTRWVRVPDATWPHADGRPLVDVAAPVEPAEQGEG